jgi:uncharacterized protein YigE (DUF2233 family)
MRRYWAVTFTGLFVIFNAGVIRAVSPVHQKLNSSPGVAVTDRGIWRAPQPGLEVRNIALERADPNQVIQLKLLRFDSRRIVARVLRSADFQLKSATVKTLAEKSGALAAINANYFDTDGKPLAFLKAGGKKINSRIAQTPLYTGVFGVKQDAPFIVHRDEFAEEQADEAVQCGPLLIVHGVAAEIKDLPARAHRRAVIGLDREQRMVIGVADSIFGGLHWHELQELFTDGRWQINAADLLNLDGGGSAQLYVKAGQFEDTVPGTTEVPVAIGFFTRH